ncbi:MAG: membrane protein insertion efficiency factor YidD [Candidatus Omnitrophota bacterium]
MKRVLLTLLKIYRACGSALVPASCRFTPSCSLYFAQAVEKYGCWRGSWLGLRRILRCHPLSCGGHDPLT